MACSAVITGKTVIFIGGISVGLAIAVALTVCYWTKSEGSNAPVVSVEQGDLRGEWVDGPNGDGFKYAAFRWVPYAAPPVKNLRLKGPLPAPSWHGVRDATKVGDECFQVYDGNFTGSEDCLILNVYTPQLPDKNNKTLLPVLFYIHGGAYIIGNSSVSSYGPDFLVTQEIVVVTINYRLSVFGFLNFENDVVPGDVALKDQIFALKWVQRNIAQFGGDPKRVTVHGHSAGGASVHWLTLLPQTEGLFRSAIMMSGSAVQGWGYTENNMWYARNLGEFLDGSAGSLQKTSQSVMEASPAELYSAAERVSNQTCNNSLPGMNYLALTLNLAPSPQRLMNVSIGEERTIFRDPESYVLNRSRPDVPVLMGMTNREWLEFFYDDFGSDDKSVETTIRDLYTYVPLSILPYEDTQRILGIEKEAANYSYHDVANYLKSRIFDSSDNSSCDYICKFKKYQDQIYIHVDLSRLARLRARTSKAKTYLYKFAVKSDYNINITEETPEEKRTAAVHSDDLNYIFHVQAMHQQWHGDGLASQTLRRMVKMWTNFVKYTDPTPAGSNDEDLTVKWDPYDVMNTTADTYLHIGPELQMVQDYIGGSDMPFWLDLYARYRENRSV